MIRYSDYNGPQNDVAMRDGRLVPFDRNAAREMAQHAHMLAIDIPGQAIWIETSGWPVAVAA